MAAALKDKGLWATTARPTAASRVTSTEAVRVALGRWVVAGVLPMPLRRVAAATMVVAAGTTKSERNMEAA